MNPSRDVKTLKGVGRDLAKKLEEMNILTVADVLEQSRFVMTTS